MTLEQAYFITQIGGGIVHIMFIRFLVEQVRQNPRCSVYQWVRIREINLIGFLS